MFNGRLKLSSEDGIIYWRSSAVTINYRGIEKETLQSITYELESAWVPGQAYYFGLTL